MTNVVLAGIAALVVAGLAAGGVSAAPVDDWLGHKIPAAEPQVTYAGAPLALKFAHPSPPASLVPPVWQAGFKWLEEATKGKLTVKEYAGGTLHGAKDGFKSARSGISDYSYCLFAHEARGFELSKVFELPFIMPANKLAAVRVVEELAPKYFKPEFERQGTYYGTIALMGASDIMSVKPIRKLEDMKGLKVIAQGFDPEAAKALGFVLVNIPYPEIYTAMQQGMVDAVLWVDPGFVPYKVFELAKFHTTLGLSAQHIDSCIARKTFDGMPTDLKRAFYDFQTRIAYAIVKKVAVDFSAEAAETYKKNGVEMITLPAEELARWKAALKPVVDDWATKVEAEGKPAKQLLADIDALARKYEKASPEEIFSLIVEKPVQGRIDF
jgi:TRAP-type C4-dicarboxylate transport system substrate-binding protein